MTHPRQLIREALIAKIKAASTLAGDRVFARQPRATRPADRERHHEVYVVFDEEPATLFERGARSYKREAVFRIYALAHASEERIEDLLDDFADQIEDAIFDEDGFLGDVLAEPLLLIRSGRPVNQNGERVAGAVEIEIGATYKDYLPREKVAEILKKLYIRYDLIGRDLDDDAEDEVQPAKTPRLFFNPEDLDGLRALAATDDFADQASRMTGFANFAVGVAGSRMPTPIEASMPSSQEEWRTLGNDLCGLASGWLATSSEREQANFRAYMTFSMDRLAGYSLWGPTDEFDVDLAGAHITAGFAICLDFIADDLDKTQRQRYEDRLFEQAERFLDAMTAPVDGEGSTRWTDDFQHNIFFSCVYATLCAVGTLAASRPGWAKRSFDVIAGKLDTAMDLFKLHGEGASHEGPAYASLAYHALIPSLELLRRHGGTDYVSDGVAAAALEDIFDSFLHLGALDWQRVVGYGDNDSSWYQGPQHTLRWIASRFKNGKAQWLADYLWSSAHGEKNGGQGVARGLPLLYDFLWKDPTVEAVEVTTANESPFRHFVDLGLVSDRSNWGSTGSHVVFMAGNPTGAATWELMKASDPRLDNPGIAHEQPNAGQVIFTASGIPFLSGVLYPYPKRSALCNVPTFKPDAEIVPILSDAQVDALWSLANEAQIGQRQEVGQVGEWSQFYGPAGAILADPPEASILQAKKELGVLFAIADLAGAYPTSVDLAAGGSAPLGVDLLLRSVFRFGDSTLIVDSVDTSQAVAYRGYFRAIHSPGVVDASIATAGATATFTVSGVDHELVLGYPSSGVTLTADRELINIEDATGVNEGGVTDWSILPAYSRYARYEGGSTPGSQNYVYTAQASGGPLSVLSVDEADPRGLTIRVDLDGTVYAIKLARTLDEGDRAAFLGVSDEYSVVTVE